MADKTQANGNGATTLAIAKKSETLPAKRNPKELEKAETLNVKPVQNVEDTIARVLTLNEQIGQRRTLINHLERIQSLKFGEFDDKDKIMLINARGESYEIKSPTLCKKLAEKAKDEITGWIRQIEQSLVF